MHHVIAPFFVVHKFRRAKLYVSIKLAAGIPVFDMVQSDIVVWCG